VREGFVKVYGSDGVRGLLYGDFSQFVMQALNAGVVLIFGFAMAYVWFKVSDLITPIRVSKEIEIEGLDMPEVGIPGYTDMPAPERNLGYPAPAHVSVEKVA
jgi:ammonium transporter, Amt family